MDGRLNELFEALIRGDRKALENIYAAASAQQFGVICRLVNDDVRAAEILKTVYQDIWKRRQERAGRMTGHWVWLMALTHRRAIAYVNNSPDRESPRKPLLADQTFTDIDLLRFAYLDATPLKVMTQTIGQHEADLVSRLAAALAALSAEGQT